MRTPTSPVTDVTRPDESTLPREKLVNVAKLRDRYDHRPGLPGTARETDSDGYSVARVQPPDTVDRIGDQSANIEAHLTHRRDEDQLAELRAQAARAEQHRAQLVQESMNKRRAEPPPSRVGGTSIQLARHRGEQRRGQQAGMRMSVSTPVTVQPQAGSFSSHSSRSPWPVFLTVQA
jgi:hypothetical protein